MITEAQAKAAFDKWMQREFRGFPPVDTLWNVYWRAFLAGIDAALFGDIVYRIRNKTDDTWWSNEYGWVDKQAATQFTLDEQTKFNLPMDGAWVREDCPDCGEDDICPDCLEQRR